MFSQNCPALSGLYKFVKSYAWNVVFNQEHLVWILIEISAKKHTQSASSIAMINDFVVIKIARQSKIGKIV